MFFDSYIWIFWSAYFWVKDGKIKDYEMNDNKNSQNVFALNFSVTVILIC